MRKLLISAAALALAAGAAQASTIQVKLVATAANTPNDGTYNVAIYAKADTINTANGDGGIAGFQADILTQGTNLSVPVSAGTGPLAAKTKNTWAISSADFGQTPPSKMDATTAMNPAYASDGDLDSLGLAFSDATRFTNTTMGADWTLISTEQFKLNNPAVSDFLNLYVVGPTYYDYNNAAMNYLNNFTTTQTTGVLLPAVPEPASMSLLGLGGLAVLARRRRA